MAFSARRKAEILAEARATLEVSCPFTCLVSKLNHAEALVMIWHLTKKRPVLSDACRCKDRKVRLT